MNLHGVLSRAEGLDALDDTAATAADVADRVVTRTGLARLLRGAWLGHPVHPLLVTVPIGAWTSAVLFDVAFGDPVAARPGATLVAALQVSNNKDERRFVLERFFIF